jgi:hypothetical protein
LKWILAKILKGAISPAFLAIFLRVTNSNI